MPHCVSGLSRTVSMMQGQADRGPVTAIAPPPISFGLPGPIFSAGHLQQFGGPPRDAGKSFQQNGQRKRPWKGKNAQQRKRKGYNNNAPRRQGPNGVVTAYRQRGNRHSRRKYTNCACCGHLPALACLGSECADGDSRYDAGLVETPRSLPSGAPLNVAHLAITEAMKPGTRSSPFTLRYIHLWNQLHPSSSTNNVNSWLHGAGGAHIPDMFSPTSTPASTRGNRDPDNDINFFGTNFGLVQDYPSESATDANASDSDEEDDNGGAKDTAYTMSLEQKVESLTQINLNLQEVGRTSCTGAPPAHEH